MKLPKKTKGFTLVELLVAIAIISILTTVIAANFVGVRQRARDGQRKSDLRQIQSALELYKADQGGYPRTSTNNSISGKSSCTTKPFDTFSYTNTSTNKTVTYMTRVPCDPLNVYNNKNYYYVSTDGVGYTLGACLENPNDSDVDTTESNPLSADVSCTSKRYYVLQNP